MIHRSHRLDDLMHGDEPWYLFARDEHHDLENWHRHFRSKNIPHAVVELRDSKRRKIHELWLRYTYDPNIGTGNSKAKRNTEVPPECLRG